MSAEQTPEQVPVQENTPEAEATPEKRGPPADRPLRQKKEKKPKKVVEKPPPPDPVTFIDARVGKIVKVAYVEGADTLFCEDVDIGDGVTKHVVTSVRAYYTLEQLQDRRVIIFTNMHPAKMRGETSEAMLFAGSTPEPDVCELLDPPADAPIGTRVQFGHFSVEGEAPGIDKKNNHWKKVAPFLRIDENGVATYKGEPLTTPQGVITVPNIRNCEFH